MVLSIIALSHQKEGTFEMSEKFPWGRIVEEHEIGPYKILEYTDKETGETLFHSGNESWSTLDEALVGVIVKRNLGPNHRQVNEHFMAGINALANCK